MLFVILVSAIRIGPVRVFPELIGAGGEADPFELAGQISLTVHLMFAAAPLIAAAAILTGLAVLMPTKTNA